MPSRLHFLRFLAPERQAETFRATFTEVVKWDWLPPHQKRVAVGARPESFIIILEKKESVREGESSNPIDGVY